MSVVTAREYSRSLLPLTDNPNSNKRLVEGYSAAMSFYSFLKTAAILPLDESAYHLFLSLRKALGRSHPSDCLIASIASVNGCTVISRNLRHYEPLQAHMQLAFEDWTE